MGGSTVKENSATSSNTLENVYTSPWMTAEVSRPVNQLLGGIEQYMLEDPAKSVTPTNGMQWDAINKGWNLGQNSGGYDAVRGSLTGAMGAAAPKVAMPGSPLVTKGKTDLLGDAAQAGVTSATAASAGPAAMTTAATATSKGYDAAKVGSTGGFLPADVERVASASLLDNLDAYKNPATAALVDATLAKYDESSGRQRAQLERDAAGAGAFGGSGYALTLGQFDADTQRNRALTDAELRASAFDRATALSGSDADRRQGASTVNAGARNALDLARGQMSLTGALADQTAENDARRFGADAFNKTELFNVGEANDAGEFNAVAANDMAKTNAGFDQATRLANAGDANATARANAQGTRDFDLSRFTAGNDMSKFNASEINDMADTWFRTANENARTNADLELQSRAQGVDAARTYADVLGAEDANTRANAASQLDLGNALYGMQDAERNALINKLKEVGGLLDPGLIEALSGQSIMTSGSSSGTGNSTTTQSGGLGSALLGGMFGLGSSLIKSERRVKRDIAMVGREPDGLGVYDFRYLWDDERAPRRRGVMVDEVAALRPWALGPVVDGIQTVNMGAL